MPRTVLFLCTGNYYRSRFAEILFNHAAERHGLPWRAESRGLALEMGVNNVGPISRHAARRLAQAGIGLEGYLRMPQQAEEADFERADLIIAVKADEHRPLVLRKHAGWEGRVEYWDMHDDYDASPGEVLPAIERAVEALVARLAAAG
jgi:protein-tyrosine phosphatase